MAQLVCTVEEELQGAHCEAIVYYMFCLTGGSWGQEADMIISRNDRGLHLSLLCPHNADVTWQRLWILWNSIKQGNAVHWMHMMSKNYADKIK